MSCQARPYFEYGEGGDDSDDGGGVCWQPAGEVRDSRAVDDRQEASR